LAKELAAARQLSLAVQIEDPGTARGKVVGLAFAVEAGRAWAVVILLSENQIFEGLTQALRQISPTLPLYGATADMQCFYQMDHGLFDALYIKDEETPYLIGQHLLRATGRFEEAEIQEIIERVRDRKLVIR
jgi:hypothetical protein